MKRRLLLVALALVTLASLFWVGIPVYVIRPFSPQTAGGMSLSYSLRSGSGVVTIVAFLLGATLSALAWRRLRKRWTRALLIPPVLILALCAWAARQNHFEWMFAPIHAPEYVAADLADHVLDDELVLGLTQGGEARAYPVRALAYHHIVNDVVAGEPVVATY